MFLVARDMYEMLVLYRRKHATLSSTFGIWSEFRVYRAPIHEYTVGRRSAVGQVSRQPALDVHPSWNSASGEVEPFKSCKLNHRTTYPTWSKSLVVVYLI